VAWQHAIFSQDLKEDDRILTAEAEYAANYIAYLQMQKRTGCVIDVIPSDGSGATYTRALEKMIDGRVKLIAITWIPTNGGLMNPAAEIGRIAKTHGIPYLLDACQAVGQMPVDVGELGCDYLAATARKFLRGPRGTGFLYVRAEILERLEPYMLDMFGAEWTAPGEYEMRPDARRFETWESSLALHLGMGAAADYALDVGLEAIAERAFRLGSALRDGLKESQGISVYDIGAEKCAIVSFSHDSVDADSIKSALRNKNINVSVSGPSSTLLDANALGLPDLVRASPHYYNSEEDIETFLGALRGVTGD
jgi:selenocysteine lyase/cysteine desulfurase